MIPRPLPSTLFPYTTLFRSLLGIVNAVIRPIILILTLPLTVLTLGLFILVVNGISVALVAWLMPGFSLAGLWAAILTSIVVGLTSWLASAFVGGSGRIERYRRIEIGRASCRERVKITGEGGAL